MISPRWLDALVNPFDFANAAPVCSAAQNSAEGDPSVMADYAGAAPRFELDAEAFMADLTDAPAFVREAEDAIREMLQRSQVAA